jgi:DNA polymerase V
MAAATSSIALTAFSSLAVPNPDRAPAFGPGPLPQVPSSPRASANLDLQQLLIPDPEHTMLLRVAGDSMDGAGIHHGDLLVVERSHPPRSGQVVVALLADGFTLKHLVRHQGRWLLQPAHPAYPCLELAEGQLWGVATHVVRSFSTGSDPTKA